MLINIVYGLIVIILIYVTIIAIKAINSGLKAKQNNKSLNLDKIKNNLSLINEIEKLKKLHSEGILNDEEFKKAKAKILK